MMNDPLTPKEAALVRVAIAAVAEAIQSLGEVPSGELYGTVLIKYMSLSQYEAVISLLIDMKLIKRANHLLTWIGPTKGANS